MNKFRLLLTAILVFFPVLLLKYAAQELMEGANYFAEYNIVIKDLNYQHYTKTTHGGSRVNSTLKEYIEELHLRYRYTDAQGISHTVNEVIHDRDIRDKFRHHKVGDAVLYSIPVDKAQGRFVLRTKIKDALLIALSIFGVVMPILIPMWFPFSKYEKFIWLIPIVFIGFAISVSAQEQIPQEKYLIKSDTTNPALFDAFQYRLKTHGDFVLSDDKKSLYTNDLFMRHRIKQLDVNTSALIAKSELDGDYAYALATWNGYLVVIETRDEGENRIYIVSLFKTINNEIKRIRSKVLSKHVISKVIVKDSSHFFVIDESGELYEFDEALNIIHQYQLKDKGTSDAACYDHEKNTLYYVSKSNEIKGFDLTNNKVSFTSKRLIFSDPKDETIYHLKLDKTRTKLIGSFNETLGVYDLTTHRLRKIGDNLGRVKAIAISPDFKTVISTGLGGGLKVWDYEHGVMLKDFHVDSYGLAESLNSSIDTVEFIDNDRFLYASSLQNVRMGRLSDNSIIRYYRNNVVSPWIKKLSNNQLAFINPRGSIYYYDLDKGEVTQVDEVPLENIYRVISDNGDRMLLSQRDGDFILLNIKERKFKDFGLSLREHFTAEFALNPKWNLFARVSSNETLQVFNIDTKKEYRRISNDIFDDTNILTFLDENIIFFSGAHSGYTKDGDYATLKQIKPFMQFVDIRNRKIYHKKGHIDEVNSYAITPDKKFLLTSSSDRTIKLWHLDLKNPRKIKLLDTAYGEVDEVYGAYFSEKKDKVLSFGANGSMVIRDIDLNVGKFGEAKVLRGKLDKNGEQRRQTVDEKFDIWTPSKRFSRGIFFDNDQKIIAFDAYDNLNAIDAKTGDILYRLALLGKRDWIKIYPDGRYISSKNGYRYAVAKNNETAKETFLQDNKEYEQEVEEAIEEREEEEREGKLKQYSIFLTPDFAQLSLEDLHSLKKILYGYYGYTKGLSDLKELFAEIEKRTGNKDDKYRRKFVTFLGVRTQVKELNKLLGKYNMHSFFKLSYEDEYNAKIQFSHLTIKWLDTEETLQLWSERIKRIYTVGTDKLEIELNDSDTIYKIECIEGNAKQVGTILLAIVRVIASMEAEFNQHPNPYNYETFSVNKAFLNRVKKAGGKVVWSKVDPFRAGMEELKNSIARDVMSRMY